MDDVKAKLDNVHKLLKKQVSFAEDVEAVDVNSDKDFEEDVNLISGTGFRFRSLKIRMDTETPMAMDRGLTSTRHRSTVHTESVASCETVRIMTHEELAAKHPHPPKPYCVTTKDIDRHCELVADRHRDSTNDRQTPFSIDRGLPLTYRLQLSKIDVARLNAHRNSSQLSQITTDNISEQSVDAPEPMQVDQTTIGTTLRKRKEKVHKHLKRGANDKELDSFTGF
ncbi:hypothetical protein F2Q69_00022596 [Brassica cretica]|uniref:Uncharacterized protein n=1 Tax=Brassica cretica TaxID=69181 RepID=A0A8S9QMR8_BRACR|nr:hypothetical protein F2Q69_00022596 [Brassica cretica]